MEEEKGQPPAYMVPTPLQIKRSSQRKWLWGLLFYAGAVTAGLVTVSILGSLYIGKMETDCMIENYDSGEQHEPLEPNKHYHVDKNGQSEDFELDLKADKEIIHISGAGYGNKSVMVLDFKKNLAGIYSELQDTCYMIGGLDRKIPDTHELDQVLSSKKDLPSDREKTEIDYVVDTARPVQDLTILPQELHALCWGKDVYWLERSEPDQASRVKREAGVKIEVIVIIIVTRDTIYYHVIIRATKIEKQ